MHLKIVMLIFITTLLMSLSANASAANLACRYRFVWRCPLGKLSSINSAQWKVITGHSSDEIAMMTYMPGSKSTHIEEFKDFVEAIEKQNPMLNYTSCFEYMSTYPSFASEDCIADVTAGKNALLKEMAKVVDDYSLRRSKAGALSFFVPGDEIMYYEAYSRDVDSLLEDCQEINNVDDLTTEKKNILLSNNFIHNIRQAKQRCKENLRSLYAQLLYRSLPMDQDCKRDRPSCLSRMNAIGRFLISLDNAGVDLLRDFKDYDWVNIRQKLALASLPKSRPLELTIGQEKTVTGDMTPLGSAFYHLKRTGPMSYRATIPARFTYNNDKKDVAVNLQDKLIKKLDSCMHKMSPYLKGPQGETLEIRFDVIPLNDSKTLANAIHYYSLSFMHHFFDLVIGDSGFRADSKNWDDTLNCKVLIHESLHLMGLVDVYKERILAYYYDRQGQRKFRNLILPTMFSKTMFDCRSKGPKDSIMGDENEAFSATVRKKRPSLLYPNEFYSLIHPGDVKRNPWFYLCSLDAYKTSFEHRGSDRCVASEFPICQGDEWLKLNAFE